MRRAYKKFALRMHPDKAASACRFGTSIVPGTPLVGDASAIEVCAASNVTALDTIRWSYVCQLAYGLDSASMGTVGSCS